MTTDTEYKTRPWLRVVFSNECDEDGDCPICFEPYEDCPCPGPTQEDLYDYEDFNGVLFARLKTC